MGIVVGIDLGTTFSAVARVGEDGRPHILPNSSGETTTPSVVAVREDGSILWGDEAKESQLMGDANAASFYKRSMGESTYVERLQGMTFDATDLSAIFLRNLLADVSAANGVEIDAAVVTVPAYFGATQREATQEALRRTGVRVLGVLNEPSAAAYAYGLTGAGADRTVLIYDLGGGTFDVTVARISADEIHVLASNGNHHLGGRDWDAILTDMLLEGLCEELDMDREGLDLSLSDLGTLAVLSERTKRELSARPRTRARVSVAGATGTVEVTRQEFEEATAHLLTMTTDLCEETIAEAAESLGRPLAWADLDGVVLIGGSTRMPQVAAYLERQTGRPPLGGVNPDEAVALGAAIYASQLAEAEGDSPRFLLGGSAPRLVDCTAHPMGMIAESPDRSRYVNSTIIPKNATVPASESREYLIPVPTWGTGRLEVYVLQGSEPRPLDNDVVGKYVVTGIEREKGDAKVRVTYSYTENATIEVSADQPALGRELTVERAEVEGDLSRFDRSPLENETSEPACAPMRVMIAIDTSGSMYGQGFLAAHEAVRGFLSSIEGAPVEVGLMCFSDRAKIVAQVGTSPEKLLACSSPDALQATNLGVGNENDPLRNYSVWYSSQGRRGRSVANCLLLLTDGVWDTSACEEAQKYSRKLRKENVVIIGIGVAAADPEFLRSISTSDSYAGLFDFSQLGETFSTIGRSIASGSEIRL